MEFCPCIKTLLFSLLFLSLSSSISLALVPANETFKFVNSGEFGPYIVEYDGSYRMLSVFTAPFQLAFYNTTPNAFTLALRMGLQRSESLFRWVWEANRGNPVRENATLSFGSNGNLVLANPDGKIVWQTNTANKGVVAFRLLATGNIVLVDSKGKFVWQSFDYPTDTLLVGQSLRLGGPSQLVSRLSPQINANGPYSLVMEPKGLALYLKSVNSQKPLLYFFSSEWLEIRTGTLGKVTFQSSPENDDAAAYDLTLDMEVANSSTAGNIILARPNYKAHLSFLRLGIDGNLKIYTYYDEVDSSAWETTFTLFDRESIWATECQLPERCGKLGVCEENQCVACPLEAGLLGWSKSCKAKKLTSCSANSFHYYKVEGVDHFLSRYTRGSSVKEKDCGSKCTKDCKCLGYFYNRESSRCWLAYELKTLTKVANATHLGFIKTPNK